MTTVTETDDSSKESNLPFDPECEVEYEGGPSLHTLQVNCEKNPGHPTFIPVKDLTIEHLPKEWQTVEHMNDIQVWCERTVKICISYTSPNRPDTYPNCTAPFPYSKFKGSKRVKRYGTGYIANDSFMLRFSQINGKPCPCRLCQTLEQPKMKYLKAFVNTATHVVYDSSEAAHAVFEYCYDSEDRGGVKCLYGVSLHDDNGYGEFERYQVDRCGVNCVTHDEELIQILLDSRERWNIDNTFSPGPPIGLIISHPHGRSKQVTLGNILDFTMVKNSLYSSGIPHEFGSRGQCYLPPLSHSDINASTENLSLKADSLSSGSSNEQTLTKDSTMSNEECAQNTQESSDELSPSLNPETLLKPGVIYTLPQGFTFNVPKESSHVCRIKHHGSQGIWLTFPPGTVYKFPNGQSIFLPPETNFFSVQVNNFIIENPLCYRSYEIDTCPGSSGAVVLCHFHAPNDIMCLSHAGSLASGENRSALDWCHNEML